MFYLFRERRLSDRNRQRKQLSTRKANREANLRNDSNNQEQVCHQRALKKPQNEAQDPRGSDDIHIHSSILQITSYTNGVVEKFTFWNHDLKYHYDELLAQERLCFRSGDRNVFDQSMTKLI